MHDPWTEQLSEHLDGELDVQAEAALSAHLQECPACRETLAQLQQVRLRAGDLADAPPATDLWPGIAARLASPAPVISVTEHRARRWHISFSLPQLAAAAVVLMALSGTGVWLVMHATADRQVATAPELAPVRPPVRLANSGDQGYERAISDLQRALRQGDTPLDSSTVVVLRQSLATIDAAIADARAALAQDPSNPFLYHHLDGAMKKKVEILQRAVSARRAAS